MSSTNQPFGFRPAYSPNGIIRPSEFPDAIASGFGTQIYIGQPVKIVGGFFQPITATTDTIVGVFAGVEWFTNNNSYVKSGNTGWIASQTYQAGTMRVWVHDDPSLVFEVQASGSVAATTLYSQVNTTNITGGNTNTGLAATTVSPTTVGAGVNGQWAIVGVQQAPDNYWADPFTILRVLNARNVLIPMTTSIG